MSREGPHFIQHRGRSGRGTVRVQPGGGPDFFKRSGVLAWRRGAREGSAAVVVGAVLGLSCARSGPAPVGTADAGPRFAPSAAREEPKLTITSPAFSANGAIPRRFTCEGEDVSPPLAWSGAPAATRSFALVVEDPDAPDPEHPQTTWVHWVVVDLPPDTSSLPEGGPLPAGAHVGQNDWKKTAYGGPCPPIGRHRYFHRLFALDTRLGLAAPTRAELEQAMDQHVLARGALMGTYEKGR